MNHSRLRVFSITSYTHCPGEGESFQVVVFNKDEKLRSHALSHFMNRTEQKDWEAVLGYTTEALLSEGEQSLRELGCPFITMQLQEVPCEQGKAQCQLYDRCSELIGRVVDAYIEAVENVIQDASQKPRYARFHDSPGNCCCWMLPDVPVLAKLMWMERRQSFNVMTCFRPFQGTNLSAQDIRDLTHRRIDLEKRGSVEWQTWQTWGILEDTPPKPAKRHEKKPPSKRRPYYADGHRNWRRYLDEEL